MTDRPTLAAHYLSMLRDALARYLIYGADLEANEREVVKAGLRGIAHECMRAGVWPEAKLLLTAAEKEGAK